MKLTARVLRRKLVTLYEEFGWDLYDKFDHAYDAFKVCLTDPDVVFSKIKVSDEVKEALIANIQKKMAATAIKLRTRFYLKCFTYEGIEAIKESLLIAREQTCDNDFKLIFQLIAPPEYKAEVVTLDKNGGIERLEKATHIIATEIKNRGGTFKLISPPTKIGQTRDELENEDIIAKVEKDDASDDTDEDNEEGIDVDLEADDIQEDEDDRTVTTQETNE